MAGELVLVTGGTGFIGAHCIIQLLEAGYTVRTTVRNLAREEEVRTMIRQGGVEPGERLEFAAADLMNDAGWPEAVAGCAYVLHVASPFPPAIPQHEDELIIPAREGALRVLRVARDAGVKRVVLTSSFASIGYGQKPKGRPYNETDWTDPAGDDIGVSQHDGRTTTKRSLIVGAQHRHRKNNPCRARAGALWHSPISKRCRQFDNS